MFYSVKYSQNTLKGVIKPVYCRDLQKNFNKAEGEPTNEVPVRHFDAGAPLSKVILMYNLAHDFKIPSEDSKKNKRQCITLL
jgi:hypothetical protein